MGEKLNFDRKVNYVVKSKPGLDKKLIEEISFNKDEPGWMRELRLKSLDFFLKVQILILGSIFRD